MRGFLQAVRDAVVAAFTQNLALKALAMLAALLIFSLVRGTDEAQSSMKCDVVVLLPPPTSGRVLVSDVPEDVRITVRGSASIIESLRKDDIPPVQVDLRGSPVRRFYFDDSMFLVPAGVRIVTIAESDASFPVEWERFVSRRVPVRVETSGRPAGGATVKQPVGSNPAEVVVSGAESRVMAMPDVETEPLSVAGLGLGRHNRQISLRRPPPHTDYDHDQPVRVALEIVPDFVERLYTGLSITVLGGQHRLDVRPSAIDVRLRGPRDVLAEQLGADRLVPYVDSSSAPDVASGTARVTPRLDDLPPSVEIVAFIPAHVFVDPHRGGASRP